LVNIPEVDRLISLRYDATLSAGGDMIDAIVQLWNASPVNPLAVAIIGWVFLTLAAVVAGTAIFWNAERVQQILTWLGAAYVVLHLFGFIEGGSGGSMFRYTPTPDDVPVKPHGAPVDYNPYIQQPGAHAFGYNPDQDPSRN
jgi:hypothetical protein